VGTRQRLATIKQAALHKSHNSSGPSSITRPALATLAPKGPVLLYQPACHYLCHGPWAHSAGHSRLSLGHLGAGLFGGGPHRPNSWPHSSLLKGWQMPQTERAMGMGRVVVGAAWSCK